MSNDGIGRGSGSLLNELSYSREFSFGTFPEKNNKDKDVVKVVENKTLLNEVTLVDHRSD